MIFRWLIGSLAVWRITHLLNSEFGPQGIFGRIRQNAGDGFWGQLLGCFYCLSLWIALPFALIGSKSWKERTLLWPGISAGAILVEHVINNSETPSAVFYEDEEI